MLCLAIPFGESISASLELSIQIKTCTPSQLLPENLGEKDLPKWSSEFSLLRVVPEFHDLFVCNSILISLQEHQK